MSKNNIEARKAYVADVVETINNSASAVLVDYRGINVEQDTAMRKALREAGVTYRVIKNSALSRAFEQTGNTGYDEYFQGPTAAAFGSNEDPIGVLPHPYRVCGQNADRHQVRRRRR